MIDFLDEYSVHTVRRFPSFARNSKQQVAEFCYRARYIIQRFRTLKSYFQTIPVTNFLDRQFGLDECDWTKITCDVDEIICHLARPSIRIAF